VKKSAPERENPGYAYEKRAPPYVGMGPEWSIRPCVFFTMELVSEINDDDDDDDDDSRCVVATMAVISGLAVVAFSSSLFRADRWSSRPTRCSLRSQVTLMS